MAHYTSGTAEKSAMIMGSIDHLPIIRINTFVLVWKTTLNQGCLILTFNNTTLVSQDWHFVQEQYTHFNKNVLQQILLVYSLNTHTQDTCFKKTGLHTLQYIKHAYSLILKWDITRGCLKGNKPSLKKQRMCFTLKLC